MNVIVLNSDFNIFKLCIQEKFVIKPLLVAIAIPNFSKHLFFSPPQRKFQFVAISGQDLCPTSNVHFVSSYSS